MSRAPPLSTVTSAEKRDAGLMCSKKHSLAPGATWRVRRRGVGVGARDAQGSTHLEGKAVSCGHRWTPHTQRRERQHEPRGTAGPLAAALHHDMVCRDVDSFDDQYR